LEIKSELPTFTKKKGVINFKTVEIDYKSQYIKYLHNNGFEKMPEEADSKKQNFGLNSVLVSMEQRLLQYGKLAPLLDVGKKGIETENEDDGYYDLDDSFIDDNDLEDDFVSSDEDSIDLDHHKN